MNTYLSITFDNCVVKSIYPEIIEDVPHAEQVLKKLVAAGVHIILTTLRSRMKPITNVVSFYTFPHDNTLTPAVEWFNSRDIPLHGVNYNPEQSYWTNSTKPYATYVIDPRAIGCPTIPYDHGRYVDWMAIEKFFYKNKILTV